MVNMLIYIRLPIGTLIVKINIYRKKLKNCDFVCAIIKSLLFYGDQGWYHY